MDVEGSRRGTKRARDSSDAAVERFMKKIDRSITKRGVARTVSRYNRTSSFAPEQKYFDVSFAATVNGSDDWATSHVLMTNRINEDGSTITAYVLAALIPTGSGPGYGQVVGNRYRVKKITVDGELVASAIADQPDMAPARTVRCVLVEDTQPNGAQATGDLLFTDFGAAAACQHSFQAMGASGAGRFRILADKTYVLQPAGASTDGTNTGSLGFTGAKIHLSKTFSGAGKTIAIRSTGATPAIATLTDCNIFMIMHASQSTPVITALGCSRCVYVD